MLAAAKVINPFPVPSVAGAADCQAQDAGQEQAATDRTHHKPKTQVLLDRHRKVPVPCDGRISCYVREADRMARCPSLRSFPGCPGMPSQIVTPLCQTLL